MTTLFGIKNCDTIKKARKWLEQHQIDYQFHDYRTDGLDEAWLTETEKQLGWESLLNTRGTTFRKLPEQDRQSLDRDKALRLMLEYPAMIKRPVMIHENVYTLGFKPERYAEIFA